MLSPEDLAYMRDTESESLGGTCRIRRARVIKDPAGGRTVEYDPDTDTILCDVIPQTVEALSEAGRDERVADYIITFPEGTRIKSLDQVDIEDAEGNMLFRYEVTEPGVGDPWETAVEVVAIEIS